jgi:hypothetical protein
MNHEIQELRQETVLMTMIAFLAGLWIVASSVVLGLLWGRF